MLGRLFKQQSSPSLKDPSQTTTTTNSYEDSYTREILYGISDKTILSAYDLNNKFFRVLVSQDGGSLRSKQVLFDSANEDKPVLQNSRSSGNMNRNILTSKVHHNTNELHDYMFGCGLPTNEHHAITKIHLLPILNNQTYGSYKSVLITRLFLLTDFNLDPEQLSDESWNPRPTLPISNSKICLGSSNTKNNVTSRFAIGLIIPLDDDALMDIISNSWQEISHYLIILQKTVSKKMIHMLNNPEGSNAIVNKRIQFPSLALANDLDLHGFLLKLIKLINYNSNIPKLINSNSLIRLSLKHNSRNINSKFNPMMLNWVLEVLNWLEFKELNESSKFLSSLLALIIPYRYSLISKPFDHDYDHNTKDITRVVVMTGNPMVAKKLIFILNGLIPDNDVYELLDTDDYGKPSSPTASATLPTACTNSTIASSDLPLQNRHFSGIESKLTSPASIPKYIDTDVDTDIDDIEEEEPLSGRSLPIMANTRPIPIKMKSKPSQSFSSSENSFVSSKGWEIPNKSTPVTSMASASSSISKNIPINKPPHRSSLAKSSSMAYLSSSLNSSLSSSASNYSLSKLGGSFMEKWRNQFNSNINYDNIDYHPNNYNFQPPSYGGINRRMSFQGMKSPSPGLEVESFNLSSNSSANATPSPVLTGAPVKSVSKIQSMFDLYNNTSTEPSNFKSKQMGDVINRSKASIYQDNEISKNEAKIHQKIDDIMDLECIFEFSDGNTLLVEEEEHSEHLTNYEYLPPNVAFTDEFRPEFILQSCPVNPRLEQQVIGAMKNDLLFQQNNCKIENITNRTIFISLRAREVKLIEMKVGDIHSNKTSNTTTPQPLSGLPINSYFNQFQQNPNPVPANDGFSFRRNANSYKTTVKKIYTPGKNNGDIELIGMIERQLNDIKELFLNSKDKDFNSKLSSLVESLLA